MRINAYIAKITGISRRQVDRLIESGRITVNEQEATIGMPIDPNSYIKIDGKHIKNQEATILIALNKPIGYVVSRKGQGAKTIYDLLPANMQLLKPIGRLDKDSSGLLLLTNDGALIQSLSHPSNNKTKAYKATLNRSLQLADRKKIEQGVTLNDGPSVLKLKDISSSDTTTMTIEMKEGRNRQIRRTFEALGYKVVVLHRISFSHYKLLNLSTGKWRKEIY
jgi:23S rRNA pseudouridine2605 synthase